MWYRKFLGKLNDFKDKEERKREQKHLKGYLRGDTSYVFGYKNLLNDAGEIIDRVPNVLPVMQKSYAI